MLAHFRCLTCLPFSLCTCCHSTYLASPWLIHPSCIYKAARRSMSLTASSGISTALSSPGLPARLLLHIVIFQRPRQPYELDNISSFLQDQINLRRSLLNTITNDGQTGFLTGSREMPDTKMEGHRAY